MFREQLRVCRSLLAGYLLVMLEFLRTCIPMLINLCCNIRLFGYSQNDSLRAFPIWDSVGACIKWVQPCIGRTGSLTGMYQGDDLSSSYPALQRV